MTTDLAEPLVVLATQEWRQQEAEHHTAVDALTAGRRERAATGRRHPVDDFLFTYYSVRPGQLRRWSPGAGVALLDAGERATWRHHRTVEIAGRGPAVVVDTAALVADRGEQLRFTADLLSAVAGREPRFGCFGLHEWAMLYRAPQDAIRHAGVPLRLGRAGTDAVVEQHPVRCSHYDAFRFFTPDAVPRNASRPTLEGRVAAEQPGCLHVGMDLYKWAYKLGPAVPGALLLDCFRLARRIREVDMRASPYDLTELGLPPIAIETAEGRAEYVALQRGFTAQAAPLRARLLEVVRQLVG